MTRKRNSREHGATTGERLFILLIMFAVAFGIWLLLRPKEKASTAPVRISRYKCMTTPDGMVPLKALIAHATPLYETASTDAKVLRTLPMLGTWFPLERQSAFYQLTADPMKGDSIGWVRAKDIVVWTTREALRPNKANPSRQPLVLWEKLEDVGNPKRIEYEELNDTDPEPAPVLTQSGGSYELALVWQSEDFTEVGVDTAWTAPLQIPDDARIYYLTTKPELGKDIESFAAALQELNAGSHAEHPVLQFLKKNIDVTVARDITAADDDVSVLQRILRELRSPLKIANKQPAEIRRDAVEMRRRLTRLTRFHENRNNWNERGFGWLPSEYLPGN